MGAMVIPMVPASAGSSPARPAEPPGEKHRKLGALPGRWRPEPSMLLLPRGRPGERRRRAPYRHVGANREGSIEGSPPSAARARGGIPESERRPANARRNSSRSRPTQPPVRELERRWISSASTSATSPRGESRRQREAGEDAERASTYLSSSGVGGSCILTPGEQEDGPPWAWAYSIPEAATCRRRADPKTGSRHPDRHPPRTLPT